MSASARSGRADFPSGLLGCCMLSLTGILGCATAPETSPDHASPSPRDPKRTATQVPGQARPPQPEPPPSAAVVDPIPDWDEPEDKRLRTCGWVVAIRAGTEPQQAVINLGSRHDLVLADSLFVLRSRRTIIELVAEEVGVNLTTCKMGRSFLGTQRPIKLRLGDRVLVEDKGVGSQILPGPPVPEIHGVVRATKDSVEPPLVLLNVGSDDEVEEGFRFSIYRGTSFVGKVVVERVLKDSSGCRVLFVVEGERVRPGDKAATRLQ